MLHVCTGANACLEARCQKLMSYPSFTVHLLLNDLTGQAAQGSACLCLSDDEITDVHYGVVSIGFLFLWRDAVTTATLAREWI